jgi:hypothetical protein
MNCRTDPEKATPPHAALRASLDRDTDLRVIEGYRLTGGRAAAVWEQGVTLWDSDPDVVDLLQQRA